MSPSLKGEGTHTSVYQSASSKVLLEPDAPLLNSTVSHLDRIEVLTPRRDTTSPLPPTPAPEFITQVEE